MGQADNNMDFDLLIVGGGMVGASLARAVSGSGWRTGIVEAVPRQADNQPSFDDRVIALSWGSRVILGAMGVWRALAPEAEPIRRIHVSDRGHFGFARLDRRELGVEALGFVVPARALGHALLEGLNELSGITWLCPARLTGFRVEPGRVRVTLAHGDSERAVSARLLVAADGGDSAVRRQLAMREREWTYGQSAVIANLRPSLPPAGTAYERFTDTGPLAMLPLTGGRCSLVWTLRDAQLDEVMGLDDRAFVERLQQRFGGRLGRLREPGVRAAYPLKLMRVAELVRPRLALIGNAAHTLHPVAGQGFNLGIRDVAALADVLADAAAGGGDPGSMEVLRRYAEWREDDQRRVALITDALVRLFANPLSPVRLARDMGLLGLDLLPAPKRLLLRQFMGLNGRLPRLSRGIPLVRHAR